MDDDLKRKLDGLFSADRSRKAAADVAANARADASKRAEARFLELREEVVIPAMREFASYIADHGWKANIEEVAAEPAQPGYGRSPGRPAVRPAAMMTFERSSYESASGGARERLPHFSVAWDDTTGIFYHTSTMGPGHGGAAGGAGTVAPDKLTTDAVQAALVKYFEKLMDDSRPYSER